MQRIIRPHSLVEIVESTLQRLEQTADLTPNDPALQGLKGTITRSIAELEVAKLGRPQQLEAWPPLG